MTEKIKKVAFYALAFLLGGCVPVLSLQPLYSGDEREVVSEPKLLGVWCNTDDPNQTWQFRSGESGTNTYELLYTDKESKKGLFLVHLVKCGEHLFFDAFPRGLPCGEAENTQWAHNAFFVVPAHAFAVVDTVEPALKLRLTQQEKLEKLLEKAPQAIEHVKVENRIVLTAPPQKLQKFLLEHIADDSLFGGPIVLVKKPAG